MKIDSFDPLKHGFHFSNSGFFNHVFGFTTRGLCGGMSMSALDYWRNGIAAPNHFASEQVNDFGGATVPEEGGRLQSAILERQVHSLTTSAVATRWALGPASIADGYHASVGPEFTEIRKRIDAGRPCVVGLWALAQGDVLGHQVLCYGYETSPMRLYVYDPNNPDLESSLLPLSPDSGVQVYCPEPATQYRGWFAADVYNWDENPPWRPRYVDLAITDGVRLNGTPDVVAGAPVEVTVTVKNVGQYTSRFKSLYVYVRDPRGYNADQLLHGAEPGVTQLQPGEARTITRRNDAFAANAPGGYRIGASFLSLTDRWCDLAVTPGTQGFIDVVAHPAGARLIYDQTIAVSESANQPVNAGVTIAGGDQIALTGGGSIWAGVWLTGNNGPEGWPDYVTTNPHFPLHGTPDSCQFSLIARVGNEPWRYVGLGQTRHSYAGGGGPLQLWINDDVHNNGNGAFTCRVQVWR